MCNNDNRQVILFTFLYRHGSNFSGDVRILPSKSGTQTNQHLENIYSYQRSTELAKSIDLT